MEYPTLQQLIGSKLDFSNEEQEFLSTIEKRSKVINYVYSILGETKIDITIDSGISETTRKIDFVNGKEYLMLAQEAWYNSGEDPALFWQNSGVLVDGLTQAEAQVTNTDWQDQALRQGVSNRANVSASGGDERTKFYISGNFLDEESIFVRNDYLRLSTRTNLEHKITDDLTVGTKLFFAYIHSKEINK